MMVTGASSGPQAGSSSAETSTRCGPWLGAAVGGPAGCAPWDGAEGAAARWVARASATAVRAASRAMASICSCSRVWPPLQAVSARASRPTNASSRPPRAQSEREGEGKNGM